MPINLWILLRLLEDNVTGNHDGNIHLKQENQRDSAIESKAFERSTTVAAHGDFREEVSGTIDLISQDFVDDRELGTTA